MKKFLISTHGFDMGIGGLKVLHRLCHLLNENGYDAYLIPQNFNYEFAIYEGYNTKMVTQEIMDNLDDVIVVYPESWYGNYLNAPNVVRWILGPPSKPHIETWSDEDLWFWFIPGYITKEYNKHSKNMLSITEQHRDVFYNRNLERSGSCWTLRKAQDIIKPNEYIHPHNSTFIPYHAAANLGALSDLFNEKDIFYCYDYYTYISIQSLMCGIKTIVVPNKDKTKEEFFSAYSLNKYIAYGEDDLERSLSLRSDFQDELDKIESDTLIQLHSFVKTCHDYYR